MRTDLAIEIVRMAVDTILTYKLRSALTILGVTIGITSIVGVTSIVRGFDESLRDTVRTLGTDTVYVSQFSGLSLSSGADFFELMQRPNLTPADAQAISARRRPSPPSASCWGKADRPQRPSCSTGISAPPRPGSSARPTTSRRFFTSTSPPAGSSLRARSITGGRCRFGTDAVRGAVSRRGSGRQDRAPG